MFSIINKLCLSVDIFSSSGLFGSLSRGQIHLGSATGIWFFSFFSIEASTSVMIGFCFCVNLHYLLEFCFVFVGTGEWTIFLKNFNMVLATMKSLPTNLFKNGLPVLLLEDYCTHLCTVYTFWYFSPSWSYRTSSNYLTWMPWIRW